MKGKKYDIEKLEASGKFDTSVSTRFYYSTQEYFDAITLFSEHHNKGFSNYTPAFVVNSDDDREEFLKECFEVRAGLTTLGLTALLNELSIMEDAAIQKDMKEFSDGQIKYRATLEICLRTIKDATMRWRMTVS